MVHVTEQQVALRAVNDHSDVAANPYGPEILVSRLFELVKAESRVSGVELQVKGSRLDDLLLFAGQTSEAICEGVSYAEVHCFFYP